MQLWRGDGDGDLKIDYENRRVQKCFEDYSEMRKHIPDDWVRTIRKHIVRLEAANTLQVFLNLGLGHPEPLKGKDKGKYSVHVTPNVRLVFRPSGKGISSKSIIMEGVVDYHGGKQTWYIP